MSRLWKLKMADMATKEGRSEREIRGWGGERAGPRAPPRAARRDGRRRRATMPAEGGTDAEVVSDAGLDSDRARIPRLTETEPRVNYQRENQLCGGVCQTKRSVQPVVILLACIVMDPCCTKTDASHGWQ